MNQVTRGARAQKLMASILDNLVEDKGGGGAILRQGKLFQDQKLKFMQIKEMTTDS